jgi:hypothetical protein
MVLGRNSTAGRAGAKLLAALKTAPETRRIAPWGHRSANLAPCA